jgi:mono/diheme cytochrome c family protein
MTRKTGARTWRSSRPAALLFLLVVLSLAAGLGRVLAVPPRQSADEGEELFQKACVTCHTVGQGDLIGPDLEGVTTRRDRDWLTRWISAPDVMLDQGDPIATELLEKYNNVPMPNLGLSEAEVASLIAFLETQTDGAPSEQTPQVLEEGNPAAGKNLFTGVNRLSNGGPSCRACHSSGGIGGLGGGKLGPDLTGAYAKLGDALITWPETSQTMKPIFSSKPLTSEEKADLLAFFESADVTQRPTEVIWQLVGLAAAGVLVFAGLAALIWRRRLAKVRGPMVTSQESRDS